MSDILRQYNWNNPRDMSQKKLINEFMKLSLSDRKNVCRALSSKRKITLRKCYDKWKLEQGKLRRDKDRQYALMPLMDWVDEADLKTDNEILLTLGILMADQGINRYFDKESSNYAKERDSYEKAMAKSIDFYELMFARAVGHFPTKEDNSFYEELMMIGYVPPVTANDILKEMKKKWIRCYTYIGTGKDRAVRLASAMENRIEANIILKGKEYKDAILRDSEWMHVMDQSKKHNALHYYNIIESASEIN